MKKTALLLTAIFLAGVNVTAQKQNVTLAESKLHSKTPDLHGAQDAILPALNNPATNRQTNTWFLAGEIYSAIATAQMLRPDADNSIMAESADSALNYYIVADSLDQLPDNTGKKKSRLHAAIIKKVKGLQAAFVNGGDYYYEQNEYRKALHMYETYLAYQSIPCMKGLGLEKDTLITQITYFCGLCGTQMKEPAAAVTYYEKVKDLTDSKIIYARLCDDYAALHDTVNMIRINELAAVKFPDESVYVRNLVKYNIATNRIDTAFRYLERAIALEPKNSSLWNTRGLILESKNQIDNAENCFRNALKLEITFSHAFGNLGRITYKKAVIMASKAGPPSNNEEESPEKIRADELFETARLCYETALSLGPADSARKEYMSALQIIYNKLGVSGNYKQ